MKLKCIRWIFRIATFADRLIGRVSQRIILIGSVSVLLEDVISVFIFSRGGGLNAFVILVVVVAMTFVTGTPSGFKVIPFEPSTWFTR